jgi:hypothetical protein
MKNDSMESDLSSQIFDVAKTEARLTPGFSPSDGHAAVTFVASESHATGPATVSWPAQARRQHNSAGPRIMFLGGDADNNLGDHAVLLSLCQTLRDFDPQVRITVVSNRQDRYSFPGVVKVIPSGITGSCALPPNKT